MLTSVFKGSLLTGKYDAGASGRLVDDEMYKARYGVDWMHKTAKKLYQLAAETGVHAATLAVSWVARNPGVTHPIISARSVEQIRPSLDAISLKLSDELYDRITSLSRQPAPATDRLEEA